MDKKEKIKTIKIFVVIYIISLILINWNDVSWIFNYKIILGMTDDFFTPYPSINASFLSENNQNKIQNEVTQNKNNNTTDAVYTAIYTEKENSLEIPAIGIFAPIVFSEKIDKTSMAKDLDKGVAYYPGSVLPGQKGQIVILGHSAPSNWPKIKYDWVFSKINDLKAGDEIIINLENRQYVYIVEDKEIIKKGEEINLGLAAENFNNLILVSCWPPGKDIQRIAVQSSLDNN